MSNKSDLLGSEKIGKLLFKMSAPAMVGIMIMAIGMLFGTGAPLMAFLITGNNVAILINNLLAIHEGDLAISTFGVVNRLLMFGLMPLFGIAQGVQPILEYR